jgi:hypothetical protein
MAMQQNYYADFSATGSTVDPAEVAKFSKLSEEWWDPRSHEMRCGRSGPGAQSISASCSAFRSLLFIGYRAVEKMQVQSQPELVSLAEGVGVLKDPSGTR